MSDLRPDQLDDPRQTPTANAATLDDIEDARPQVAATRAQGGLWLAVGGAAALGLLAFVVLSANRNHQAENAALPSTASVGARQAMAAAAPPPELLAEEAAGRGVRTVVEQPPYIPPTPPPVPFVNVAASGPGTSSGQRAPTLVVDFAETAAEPGVNGAPAVPASTTGAEPAAGKPGAPGAQSAANGNSNEQFATRVGAEQPEHAEATQLHDRATLVAQGVTITGVLETALNSDLPGFARAVVSREVRGFDGSRVLVPRGSRVIGQYRSAVAQGQTRAFVIWTRIIRPDGVSIQIASSGTDPLGRAGLAGKVDTHFFQRFSGAILLSVIDAGLNNLSNRNSTSIVIGSSSDAATASLSALIPTAIPPTIKVAQGSPIRIFVARDLDFSSVKDWRP